MKIDSVSLVNGMSGKLSKKDKIVFSNRYGNIHAWEMNAYKGPFTAAQEAKQQLFAEVAAAVRADLTDPEVKAQWEEVAKKSSGKYKTAYGAAFASKYKEMANA